MNYRDDLLRAFNISLEDLEANRVGRLGAMQQRNLLRSGNWNVVAAVLICLALGAILYGVASRPLVPVQGYWPLRWERLCWRPGLYTSAGRGLPWLKAAWNAWSAPSGQ